MFGGAPVVAVGSSASYEPFGPLSGLTFGNGVVAAFTYDQDYELTGIAAANGTAHIQSLTNGYDPAGNITSITDALASSRSQTLGYDNLNRLNAASGLYGSQSYTYDGVGNRLTRVIGSTTDTYAYSTTANQISTITTGSNVRSFSYLPSGQVSQDVRDPSHTYTFSANDNGRNASAALNASTVGSYLYNAFEQRVQKVASSTTTQQVYDRFGHLLEDANASGVVQKEYIWLDDLPVAMVDDTGASPVVYFMHTDQLGTPQKITDASAQVVWDGVYDPFGNAVSLSALWGSPTQWGSFTWEPTTPEAINLRFPGQYYDAETALNQNWFRDYDSTSGRYIQSDPIGLLSGVNTYGYVGGNPFVLADPRGLFFGIPSEWVSPALEAGLEEAAAAEAAGLGPEDPFADIAAIFLLTQVLAAESQSNNRPSRCTPPQCQIQYDADSETCSNLKSAGARGRCWESAADRLAHCVQTNGEVGWPPLQTR